MRAAIRPETTVLWGETLANPTMSVADLPGLAAIAREAGVALVVDSTFASPAVCRPLEHGVDLVVHSATKYLGGHSDATGGVAVGPPELMARVRHDRIDLGGMLAPDEAFLLHRGLATLPLRVAAAVRERAGRGARRWPSTRASPGSTTPGCRRTATTRWPASSSTPGRYGAVVTVTPHGGRDGRSGALRRLELVSVGDLARRHALQGQPRRRTDPPPARPTQALAAAGIGAGRGARQRRAGGRRRRGRRPPAALDRLPEV